MPKKVLGNDPFAHPIASATVSKASERQRKKAAVKTPASGSGGRPRIKHVRLLEPSSNASSTPDQGHRVKKGRGRIRPHDDENLRLSAKRAGSASRSHRDRTARSAAWPGTEASYEKSVEDVFFESADDFSEGDEERGMLSRVIDGLFLRRLGRAMGKRHMRTRSEDVDDFGRDPVYAERLEPLFEWLYQSYWRVEVDGIGNVPEKGKTLLVANHSGLLPFDGIMISEAIRQEGRRGVDTRFLVDDEFSSLPFLSPFLARIGAATACPENTERLLRQDEIVCIFPEGARGARKGFSKRYQLRDFGDGEFISLCMQTKAVLVPVAVVGAEESYPVIAKCKAMGKPLGLPYMPITPLWPFLGLLGLVPLPAKWKIQFGKPIRFNKDDVRAMRDETHLLRLQEDVREAIQDMLDDMLNKRKSIWLG